MMAESKRTDPQRQSVAALVRGLDILRCFDRPRVELTVSDIARRVKLSQPTTWRLCSTLIDQGFLVRASTGAALRIGAPALTLGYAAIKGLDLPALALPYMRALTERLAGGTTLSIRQGIEMISVEHCEGDFFAPNQPVGWRTALSSVPSGLAVLAELPFAERDDVLAQLEARDPAAWPRRSARVVAALDRYARDDVVELTGMHDGQFAAVAVPLVEQEGNDIRYWAISCGGLRARWDDDHLAEAAQELTKIRGLLQPALTARAAVFP